MGTLLEVFGHAAELFGPDRIGMHLVVGLGESDRDVLGICRRLVRWVGTVTCSASSPKRAR